MNHTRIGGCCPGHCKSALKHSYKQIAGSSLPNSTFNVKSLDDSDSGSGKAATRDIKSTVSANGFATMGNKECLLRLMASKSHFEV